MAALDGLSGVIRIGSFSKTLSAALRCGYIAARPEWIEALTDLQLATGFGGPSPLVTDAIRRVLAGGSYRRHMEELRRKLTRARSQLTARLAPLGIRPEGSPVGGFTLWCRLPEGVDAMRLARRCLDRDVVLAPGNVFSPGQRVAGFLRCNVTQTSEQAVATIGQALREVA